MGEKCVWGGSAPRSVFDEDVVKAGCLDDVLGGRDPPCAGPHPDMLLTHIKPLRVVVASYSVTAAIPLAGFVNSHSHAFQRALRGRAAGTDSGRGATGCSRRPIARRRTRVTRSLHGRVPRDASSGLHRGGRAAHYLGAAEAYAPPRRQRQQGSRSSCSTSPTSAVGSTACASPASPRTSSYALG